MKRAAGATSAAVGRVGALRPSARAVVALALALPLHAIAAPSVVEWKSIALDLVTRVGRQLSPAANRLLQRLGAEIHRYDAAL